MYRWLLSIVYSPKGTLECCFVLFVRANNISLARLSSANVVYMCVLYFVAVWHRTGFLRTVVEVIDMGVLQSGLGKFENQVGFKIAWKVRPHLSPSVEKSPDRQVRASAFLLALLCQDTIWNLNWAMSLAHLGYLLFRRALVPTFCRLWWFM